MSDELKELLPCPFCGGQAEVIREGTSRQSAQAGCTNCACILESNEIGSGDKWNTRASQWIPVGERLPEDGDEVICCYVGVYGPRIVNFWRDAGLNPHFGLISEPDGKGSQPATHWMPIPPLPTPPKDKAKL